MITKLSMTNFKNFQESALKLSPLTAYLVRTKWRLPNEAPKLHLFGQLKRVEPPQHNCAIGCLRIWPASASLPG